MNTLRPVGSLFPWIFLFAFCIGLCPVHAQRSPDLWGFSPAGFDPAGFEFSFSRADRELSPSRWMSVAREGLSYACGAWERLAVDLYADGEDRSKAQGMVEEWSETQLEERFARWLESRFLPTQTQDVQAQLFGTVQEANRRFLYQSDPEGSLLYDPATGDPLIQRPGAEPSASLDQDRSDRDAYLRAALEAALVGFAPRAERFFPELLSQLRPESRAFLEERISASMDQLKLRGRTELEALLAREERFFLLQRTSDVYSLRKKSEELSAEALGKEILAQVEEECALQLESLEARIEAIQGGTEDLEIAGEAWLSAYREQFSRGLAAWEEGERRFMVRRIEWEQRSRENAVLGEEAWSGAFVRLEEERRSWEAKAQRLFESGAETFSRASDRLELSIEEARTEYLRDAELRTQAGADRARSWVDTYLTCASVVGAARENVAFWTSRLASSFGLGAPPSWSEDTLPAWLESRRKDFLSRLAAAYTGTGTYAADSYRLETLRAAAAQGELNLAEAQNQKLLSIESFEDIKDRYEFLIQQDEPDGELLASLEEELAQAIEDASRAVESWESAVAALAAAEEEADRENEAFLERHALYYDLQSQAAVEGAMETADYDALIQRARTGLGYSFNEDILISLGEAERWISAQGEYVDKALQAQSLLVEDFGLAVGSSPGALADILDYGTDTEQFFLDEYQVELIRAKAVAGYWARRVEIAQAVASYAAEKGAARATDSETLAAWTSAKAAYDASALAYQQAQQALRAQGDALGDLRAELSSAADAMSLADQRLEELNSEYALKMAVYAVMDNSFLKDELLALYRELCETRSGIAQEGPLSAYALYLERGRTLGYSQALEVAGETLKSLVRGEGGEPSLAELHRRVQSIIVVPSAQDLPSGVDALGLDRRDAAYALIGALLAERDGLLARAASAEEKDAVKLRYGELVFRALADARGRSQTSLGARLEAMAYLTGSQAVPSRADSAAAVVRAQRELNRARVALERDALTALLDPDAPVSEDARRLAGFSSLAAAGLPAAVENLDDAQVQASIANLEALLARMDSLAAAGSEAYARGLEDFGLTHPDALGVLRGEGFFRSPSGLDLCGLFLGERKQRLEKAEATLASSTRVAEASASLDAQRRDAAYTTLRSLFSQMGLSLPVQQLPPISELGSALLRDPRGMGAALSDFLLRFDGAFKNAPGWMVREGDAWKTSLIEYASARALSAGILPSRSSELVRSEMEALAGQREIYNRLRSETAGVIPMFLALGPQSIPSLSREALEAAVVRSLAQDLATLGAAWDSLGETELRAALRGEAETRYPALGEALRSQGVDGAIESIALDRALEEGKDPATLDGRILQARLESIFTDLSSAEGESAQAQSVAQGLVDSPAQAAHILKAYLGEVLAPDAGQAEWLAALYGDGPEGIPSWMEQVHRERGDAFYNALETILNDCLDSIDDGAPLSDFFVQLDQDFERSLAPTQGYLASLGDRYGSASGLAAQLWFLTSAAALQNQAAANQATADQTPANPTAADQAWAYLERVLAVLGVQDPISTEALRARFGSPDFDLQRELFLAPPVVVPSAGLPQSGAPLAAWSYAAQAALFRLKQSILSGDREMYRSDREYLLRASIDGGDAFPLGPAVVQNILAEGDAFQAFYALRGSYAGSAVSGNPLGWAISRCPRNTEVAFALAESLGLDDYGPQLSSLIRGGAEEALRNLQSELDSKKYETAYLERIEAAMAGAQAAAVDGKEHWRTFLRDSSIWLDANQDGVNDLRFAPAGFPESAGDLEDGAPLRSALIWAEGNLTDAYEQAERSRVQLGQAFSRWNGFRDPGDSAALGYAQSLEALRLAASAYNADPETPWAENLIIRPAAAAVEAQSRAAETLRLGVARETAERRDLARLGEALEETADRSVLKRDLDALSQSILDLRQGYGALADAYASKAEDFYQAGSGYDAVYAQAKATHRNLESARNLFEREDAIRRWAATDYLKSQGEDSPALTQYRDPQAELSYTLEAERRAQAALEGLRSLYAPTATDRPFASDAYNALHRDYGQSFDPMLASLKARDNLAGALAQEYRSNDAAYSGYRDTLFGGSQPLFAPLSYASGYAAPSDLAQAGWKDVLRLSNGSLDIAFDASFALRPVDTGLSGNLKEYFEARTRTGSDIRESTPFERSIRDWSVRMGSYNFDGSILKKWGLARDYALTQLIKNNPSFAAASASYSLAEELYRGPGTMDVHYLPLSKRMDDFRNGRKAYETGVFDAEGNPVYAYTDPGLPEMQKEAWDSLGVQEKEDLRFYLALSLSGSGGSSQDLDIFSRMSAYAEYAYVDQVVTYWKDYEDGRRSNWFYGWWAQAEYDKLSAVQGQYASAWKELNTRIAAGANNLRYGTGAVVGSYAAYRNSCLRLAQLEGQTVPGAALSWSGIRASLVAAGGFTEAELLLLGSTWTAFQAALPQSFSSLSPALGALASWTRTEREDARRGLESCWAAGEDLRRDAESRYRTVYDSFIKGSSSYVDLVAAAAEAYGPGQPSLKTHLVKMEQALGTEGFNLLEGQGRYGSEYTQIARDYAGLIGRVLGARLEADFATREGEWELLRTDLDLKQQAWREAASLILERGREDWRQNASALQERFASWRKSFQDDYSRGRQVWDAALLDGLAEKERWVRRTGQRGEAALVDASARSALSLGLTADEAQRQARRLDTQGPMTIPGLYAPEEARASVDRALQAAGIANLSGSFAQWTGSAASALLSVRSGLGGPAVWDSARVQGIAAQYARASNSQIAAGQARLLAVRARETISQGLAQLEGELSSANRAFKDRMDDTFVLDGRWRREGTTYAKDVVTHSTLVQAVITERAQVDAFVPYALSAWQVSTDLSPQRLTGMDAFGIQALIGRAQEELAKKGEAVFGTQAERSRNREPRTAGPGEFGRYLGFEPSPVTQPDLSQGLGGVWFNSGAGELGRLMRSYLYWSMKETQGWAAMSKPVYEKSAWDDRGSWVKAPTIRGAADLAVMAGTGVIALAAAPVSGGGSILAAAALSTALNMTDDALFTYLDVQGGYKSWDSAGFEFGKKALASAAGSLVGGAFSGAGGLTDLATRGLSGASATVLRSGFAGLESLSTATLTGAINAVTYRNGSLGWSEDAFAASLRTGLIGAAGSASGSLAGGLLRNLNSKGDALYGFSRSNKIEVESLNTLTGSLVSQGTRYALGGQAQFNLGGLLELSLSQGSASLGLGGGGTNLGSLGSALRGAGVWAVNSSISAYTARTGLDLAVALRAQYGFGDRTQKSQLADILKGDTLLRTASSASASAAAADYVGAAGNDAVADSVPSAEAFAPAGTARAQTLRDGTARVVRLQGYDADLSREDQLRLAIALGHEAYRDGYGVGESQADGSLETQATNFQELTQASVARVQMGRKLDEDYGGFFQSNVDLAFESFLHQKAQEDGDGDLFQSYLRDTYEDSEDFYWPQVVTGGKNQNQEAYRTVPLLGSKTQEETVSLNAQNLASSVANLKEKIAKDAEVMKTYSIPKNYDDAVLEAAINQNSKLQKEVKYKKLEYESLYLHGCMLLSAVYGAQTASGKTYDLEAANALIKDSGLFLNQADLSKELLSDVMSSLTDGDYKFELLSLPDGQPSKALLKELADSSSMYLAHLRIKREGAKDAYHSEMLSSLEWKGSDVTVHTANPWKGSSYTGNTNRTMGEIARWDIYRVRPTWQYWSRNFHAKGIGR